MTIVDLEMGYRKSSQLLRLIRAYGWSRADAEQQEIVVENYRAALDAAELAEGL